MTLSSMNSSSNGASSTATVRIAIIVLTTLLYAAGKWLTASIPTPWGVGELLIGVFLPALLAVLSETLPVAIGAGLGTLVGDLFVTGTNSALSLVAGVPANFIAFLFFGWFVKRYRSWPSFVAATIAFVTLGNLIAATNVYLFAKALIGISVPSSAILGLTIFWNTTSIPAIIIAVPLLVRALRPLQGRSKVLAFFPEWTASIGGRQAALSLFFALIFIALGAAAFVLSPASVATEPGLGYFALAGVLVLVFGPVANTLAGSKRK
jgi:hypothetical protein